MNKLTLTFLLILSASALQAQKQLLVMKREKVLLRLYPGDEVVFRLKNNKRIWRTYINNLSDSSMVTHRDTIAFHHIDRVYFRQSTFANRVGGALVTAGVLLFVIDQVNQVIVQGNDFSIDDGTSRASLAGIATGLPLIFIQKKSQKIRGRYRLYMADKRSTFYLPDTRPVIGN